jgi:queuine tRNA-ribosyltransferase
VLRHLHYAQDPLFETLASIHNVHFYEDLMRDIRAAIEAGRYAAFRGEWLARYTEKRGRVESEA